MTEQEKPAVPAEMEGGGYTWWIVCGECHGAIDPQEKVCHHCKTPIDWTGFESPGKIVK